MDSFIKFTEEFSPLENICYFLELQHAENPCTMGKQKFHWVDLLETPHPWWAAVPGTLRWKGPEAAVRLGSRLRRTEHPDQGGSPLRPPAVLPWFNDLANGQWKNIFFQTDANHKTNIRTEFFNSKQINRVVERPNSTESKLNYRFYV